MRWTFSLFAFLLMAAATRASAYDVTEKSVFRLQEDLSSGRVTSEALVRAYLARIDAIDRKGPALRSIIAVNPNALADARARDKERKQGGAHGPLFGIPVLVKDNIETADPVATTAGSLALASNITHRDAPAVARLRAAGAIILGKTNLSEWANIRSTNSISGWSAIGGLAKNPYVLDRSTCGSSAGSGAAIAASLGAVALGTETDGSLVCPGSFNGIVALKPTLGLVSRTHIIPIAHSQDTAGPMTRTVGEAALLLSAMAGTDPADPATQDADTHKQDYFALLSSASLKGKRIGISPLPPEGERAEADVVFAKAVEAMRAAGAEIVEIKDAPQPDPAMGEKELVVLTYELKHDLNEYLGGLSGEPRTLADLITFNKATPRETVLFGQELFEIAEATKGLDDPTYVAARDALKAHSRGALDKLISTNRLDAFVTPSNSPAFRTDLVRRDSNAGTSASFFPATAGYPHLTVPMGYVGGLPVGLSFLGPAWSDGALLQLGYAFEKAVPARKPPGYIPSLEALTPAAFKPAAK